jgi:hypothetical protein
MLRAFFVLQKAGAVTKHRLAITPTSIALSHLRTSCLAPSSPNLKLERSHTTTPKHIRKRLQKEKEAQRPPVHLNFAEHLQKAIQANDIGQIITAYNGLRTQFPLGEKDVADMANALHTALRLLPQLVRQTRLPTELNTLADILVADIQAKVLPPSYDAHLHLLSFYKESAAYEKGNTFWSWLVKQNDDYVNANLYGVALELFAFQGRPAEDTESLYQKALSRFPGVFLEYHLTHNAVIADRSQPTVIHGIPRALLQGILTARILRGDATNAYLTLDTALRLFPTKIPSRFITLFVQERPLNEAYKVFFLACRAGTMVGHDALKMLLTRLRKAAAARPIENAALLRAMITACYAHATAGAALHNKSLNELVIAITGLLKDRTCSAMSPETLRPATDAMKVLLQSLFTLWADQNSPPGIASFNSIIANLAGKGKQKDVIASTFRAITDHGLKPNAVTFRSVLSAVGDLNEAEAVRSAWTDLVAHRIATGAAVDLGDWQNLLSAARRINDPDYVRQQLINFEHIVSPSVLERLNGALASEDFSRQPTSYGEGSVDGLIGVIGILQRDVDFIRDNIHQSRQFYTNPLPMSLDGQSYVHKNVPELHIRAVYDEMTTDSSGPNFLPDTSLESETEVDMKTPAVSSTGYSFDELRYQNWKTINELLSDASLHDKAYMKVVDEAIQRGTPPPVRDMGLRVIPGLHDYAGTTPIQEDLNHNEQSAVANNKEEVTLDDFRQRILELRGPKA